MGTDASLQPDVLGELLLGVEVDQEIRRSSDRSPEHFARLRKVDEDNTEWLKQIIAELGWPGRSLVGQDGADAAWLLAQHADHDPEFQERCLNLLEEACEHGDADRRHVAYLTDRVLVNAGKPQLYGTQYIDLRDGRGYQPRAIQDAELVDQRRAAMGVEPFAEYDKLVRQLSPSTSDADGPGDGEG